MKDLILYFRPTCFFCRKVTKFIEDNNVPVMLKNVAESSDVYQELVQISGKGQVPCLVIDGQAMFESDDIVDWLNKNKDQL